MNTLKERYGENVPVIKEFATSYRKIGFVWKHHLCKPNQQSVDTIMEYPPSPLDETSVTLPDNNGIGWTKRKESKQASVHSKRQWAEAKLQDHASTVLVIHGPRLWCTISKHSNGSIWVEYNGRKMVLVDK